MKKSINIIFSAWFLLSPTCGTILKLQEWTWIHEQSLDGLYIATGSLSISLKESLTECFIACHTHSECLSFFTWGVDGSLYCELNSKIFVAFEINNFAIEAVGFRHYKTTQGCPTGFGHRFSKPARMCIHLAAFNDKTYAEATSSCENLTPGAELIVLDTDVKRAEVAKTVVANSDSSF
ncbi:hypothetical protein RRG08_035092 [Elysia crispata]|uniref:Apple domain-containing protein n=1 Tax=Elysia crispata TaxID=231223 RepID=A0AAE0ZSA5_9GAST|nr:hypothetical protein RRG08_035092 [Elysia crispata]